MASARRALFGSVLGRLTALVLLVALSGAACGLAFGYPVGSLDLQVSSAVQLDHNALQGTFDLEQALAQVGDLPKGWQTTDRDFTPFSLFGPAGQFCGETVDLSAMLDQPLRRAFVGPDNPNSQIVLVSEVAQFKRVADARLYRTNLAQTLTGCTANSFNRKLGDKFTKVEIRDDLGDGPVVDYLARSLVPVEGGAVQVFSVMQVGSAVVALQFVGARPGAGLISGVEKAILTRVAPRQFGPSAAVSGVQPLPTETTTTTTETTTTTTTTLIPQATTTTRPRSRPSTTRRPTTAPPTTAAPAPAPAPTAPPGQ